ncbi:copia protein [Tanacetum coccineum]
MRMVDNTLFTKKSKSHLIIVQIYVDGIIFGSMSPNLCDDFAKIIHDVFEMSMMEELNFFLGLKIKQIEDRIFFNQSKYIKEMLKKFGLEDSKPTKTPMSTEIKLTKDDEADSAVSSAHMRYSCLGTEGKSTAQIKGVLITDSRVGMEVFVGEVEGVFDFGGLPDLMAEGLSSRTLIEHRDAQGQSVFTSRASRRLFDIRGPLVNELILEFFSTFRFGVVVLDLDTVGALQFSWWSIGEGLGAGGDAGGVARGALVHQEVVLRMRRCLRLCHHHLGLRMRGLPD